MDLENWNSPKFRKLADLYAGRENDAYDGWSKSQKLTRVPSARTSSPPEPQSSARNRRFIVIKKLIYYIVNSQSLPSLFKTLLPKPRTPKPKSSLIPEFRSTKSASSCSTLIHERNEAFQITTFNFEFFYQSYFCGWTCKNANFQFFANFVMRIFSKKEAKGNRLLKSAVSHDEKR